MGRWSRVCAAMMAGAVLVACSGTNAPATKPADAPKPAAEAKAAAPLPADAAGVVELFRARGLPIGQAVILTAETDSNKLLGRPNQYTGKATFIDTRLPREHSDEIKAEDGGTVETFAEENAAKARHAYVTELAKAPLLAEYAFLDGKVLVRLSKRLTPDQAGQYELLLKDPAAVLPPVPTSPPAPPAQPAPKPAEKPAAAAPPPPSGAQRVRVTGAGADGVNMRAEPSTTAARVKLLRDGAQLEIVGEDRTVDGRTWRNVKDTSEGATGWVAADFVQAAEAPPAAPAAAKPAEPTPALKPTTTAGAAKPVAEAKPSGPAVTGNGAAGVAPSSQTTCPATHPVKGNQGSRSNVDWIYHVPTSRSYGATHPERCFASAAEASAAGYRAPDR